MFESHWQSAEMVDKLKDAFDEMLVYKDLQKANFTSSFKLPSFMRDWVLKRFQDDDGAIDVEAARTFIKEFIPRKEDWKSIKNRIINDGEQVKFLAKISVDIDIKTQVTSFSLPDFSLGKKDTVIPHDAWEKFSKPLLKSEENWGVVELGYQYPESAKDPGKLKLVSFQDFCPYDIDLEEFRYARESFTLDEWIDIVLGAVDYNAAGYEDRSQKLAMIKRLLPFVEKRLNLIELAPKETGKSYLFGSVSRYSWLSSGGTMSRARMFYDLARRMEGLVFNHDYVALDEIQSIKFTDIDEMRGALKGYMENGRYTVGDHEGMGDAGIILLGNINTENMNEYINMFRELPKVFHESALIDRFHGFLKGWDIPKMHDDLKVCGWALNSEYFSSVMHALRDEPIYRTIVDELVEVAATEKANTRDTEAVKRMCTAYLKLLFPHVRSPRDIDPDDFAKYCLHPAHEMRSIIKMQMGLLDPGEFGGKSVPTMRVRNL